MDVSYVFALKLLGQRDGGHCLDCGADSGASFNRINKLMNLDTSRYHGIEWDEVAVNKAKLKGLNVIGGDLNKKLPFEDEKFRCVFGLSVLEHLLNGCAYMKECHRVLEKGGKLILLTYTQYKYILYNLLVVVW